MHHCATGLDVCRFERAAKDWRNLVAIALAWGEVFRLSFQQCDHVGVEPGWVQLSGFQQLQERILVGGSVLESSIERVKKDHLPIRLLEKGIAHSSYCQQSMRPGQQPLPIMQKPSTIDSIERHRQMLHPIPSHPCKCIAASLAVTAMASRA